MENASNKKRIAWLDTAKGIGIFLVALGHVPFIPKPLMIWVFSFHMPLFFLLAGITYNYEKYSDFKLLIKNKFRDVFIPCMLFSFLTFFLSSFKQLFLFIKTGTFDKNEVLGTLAQVFVQNPTSDFQTGFWFLCCIFVCFILLHIIMKISKNNIYAAMVISALFMIAGYVYSVFFKISLPWSVDTAFIAVFFMTCGVFLQPKLKKEFKNKPKLAVFGAAALAVNIACTLINYKISQRVPDMRKNVYGNPLLFIIAAFSGIVFVICISNLFYSKAISFTGNQSLYYYAAHIKLIAYVAKAVNLLGASLFVVRPAVYALTVICAVLVMLASTVFYPIYKFVYKTVVKILRL